MKERTTSFGSLTPVLEQDGRLVAELAVFVREGRSHSHDEWEICFVQSGTGTVIVGDERHEVEPGQTLSIPPNTPHWMIPSGEEPLSILIIYTPHYR